MNVIGSRLLQMNNFSPLLTTSDYNCIIANNDAMALGAVEAIESANLNPADIPVVGIDGQADGCAAVESGKLAMTVYQSAKGQGIAAINVAVNIIEGKKSVTEGTDYEADAKNPNMIWVPFEPIYPENVADYQ